MRRLCGDSLGQAAGALLRESGPWMAGRRNVVEGFAFYHLPLLASYSRSGTNWLRYAVEVISGRPTPGQKRLYKGPDPVFDRAHKAYAVMEKHPRVVLVLRDYRECLLRQHLRLWQQKPEVAAFLEAGQVLQPPAWYLRNIEAFDRYGREKLLLYYEDLLLKPETSLRALSAFLGLDPAKTEEFLREVGRHYRESIEAYTYSGHTSQTSLDKDVQGHARKWLTPDQQREFDLYYQERHPDLYERYLKRYAFSENAAS